jgi:hypothetical protein
LQVLPGTTRQRGIEKSRAPRIPKLSTVFVHNAVDNELSKLANRLIDMEFLTEDVRRGHSQALGARTPDLSTDFVFKSVDKPFGMCHKPLILIAYSTD